MLNSRTGIMLANTNSAFGGVMGFYLRKSISVGPFRFNLSNSGAGVSSGIKGIRIGSGPRGNYVHMGRGGIYYRATLPSSARTPVVQKHAPSQAKFYPAPPSITHGHATDIDSIDANEIVDSSSKALLDEITEKQQRGRYWPWVASFSALTMVLAITADTPAWITVLLATSGIAFSTWVYWRDVFAKSVVIMYELDSPLEQAMEALHLAADGLTNALGVWHIPSTTQVHDRKYHAGASSLLARARTHFSRATPPLLQTNVQTVAVNVGAQTLHFFPDRVLIYTINGVGSVAYQNLNLEVGSTQFIEEDGVPADATVVGQTWKYVNKKGGPDRRFKDNRQLPICRYDELRFKSETGLHELVHVSRLGAGAAFAEALAALTNIIPEEKLLRDEPTLAEIMVSKRSHRRVDTPWPKVSAGSDVQLIPQVFEDNTECQSRAATQEQVDLPIAQCEEVIGSKPGRLAYLRSKYSGGLPGKDPSGTVPHAHPVGPVPQHNNFTLASSDSSRPVVEERTEGASFDTPEHVDEPPAQLKEVIGSKPGRLAYLRSKYPTTPPAKGAAAAAPDAPLASSVAESEELHVAPLRQSIANESHVIPAPPPGYSETRWIRPGEEVVVAGITLAGGMIYVGPKLKTQTGSDEPALINPRLTVADHGDFRDEHAGYWSTYADLTPAGRRAYLTWLAQGRSHPDCEPGLVILFFCGLERRALVDQLTDTSAPEDRPLISREIRRLLVIYEQTCPILKRHAGELLSWLELDGVSGRLYEQPVPEFPRTYEVPPYVKLALGQAAVDRKPLPASLALSWVRLSPECYLRTPALRCPDEFSRLFAQRYHELFGDGLVLPKNQTGLNFIYRPISGGLRETKITMGFENVPDVTAQTAPIRNLIAIAAQCTDELGSYSRLVGKDATLAGSLEGLLLLPISLWPAGAQARLDEITNRVRMSEVSFLLRELLVALGGSKLPVSRDRIRGLARVLEAENIGMEPHVLAGARIPGPEDAVVLFTQPAGDADAGSSAEFQTAALTLQLAAAMAQADGDFNSREVEHLRAEIEGWAHLTAAERRRLNAHLQLLIAGPPTLAALKKKLEPLPLSSREMVAAFMATLAQSDGFVSPGEVKFLEKVYKALGVEVGRVFSDVHAASAGSATSISTKQAEKSGFYLDAERIAALQEDTARVSALLSTIFTEDLPTPKALPEPEPLDRGKTASSLGLDDSHLALLRLMLSRPCWTRAELRDAAADLELMLDGALEVINEATFDAYDAPLCEGDDPLEINSELLEKFKA